MAEPQGPYLEFGCPQCMTRLRARPSQAGTKQRCPRCQHQFNVPTAEQAGRLARRSEDYSVDAGDYEAPQDPSKAVETAAVAECHRCNTRTYGPAEQIGQEIPCPDCGTPVVFRQRRQAPPKQVRQPGEEGAYELQAQAEGPSESGSTEGQAHVSVHCPVCDTLLQATLDEVGKHLLCPDCYTPVLVLPPHESVATKPAVAHPVDEEYDVREPTEEPAPDEPPSIPMVCSLCETRMYATPDQVGEMVTCPECSTPMVVPRPKTAPKPPREATTFGEYGAEEPELQDSPSARAVRVEPRDSAAAARANLRRMTPVRRGRPRWPLLTGIVSFPFYQSVWPRFLGLVLGLLPVLLVALFAVALLGVPNTGMGAAIPWIAAMVFFAATFTLICVWGIVATAFLLAIAQDTAEGADQIDAWPEATFVDWAAEVFFIVNSFVVGVLPGVVAFQVLNVMESPFRMAAVPCSLFFLFPVVLLSMLESGSVFVPMSASVAGSLLSKFWAWAVFYVETAVLVAALLGLAGVLLYFLGPWSVFLTASAGVWGLMVYFRLLGRLAWCCGPGREGHDEEAEDRSGDRAPKVPPMAMPDLDPAPRRAPQGDTIPLAEPTEPEAASPPPDPSRTEPTRPTPEPPAEPPTPQPPPAKRPRSILDDDFDAS